MHMLCTDDGQKHIDTRRLFNNMTIQATTHILVGPLVHPLFMHHPQVVALQLRSAALVAEGDASLPPPEQELDYPYLVNRCAEDATFCSDHISTRNTVAIGYVLILIPIVRVHTLVYRNRSGA